MKVTGGLGVAAVAYVGVDYLQHISPSWHAKSQSALWSVLALVAISRVPSYKHWTAELRAALPFLFSLIFMLATILIEALSVRFVTAVLGLDWHRNALPLPDTGQWMLLALNERLPLMVVEILRARIIGLHHFLMLFIMLAFSVLFGSVKAPGLGLGARYMFTMAIGRILRTISFAFTILPSPRPWCASVRYNIPSHPHIWAQKYYVPYSSGTDAIRRVLQDDFAYANVENYAHDLQPDWGLVNFLIDYLRPTVNDGSSWYTLLRKAGGGCNDLLFSGHMLVAVLTAVAWTEAYGRGVTSILIWLSVIHSAQREIRERHHYTVDCVVAVYVGVLLWKMTGFIWSPSSSDSQNVSKMEKLHNRLVQAAKDSDMEAVRELLMEAESNSRPDKKKKKKKPTRWSCIMWIFPWLIIFTALTVVFLAFSWTSDG